MPWISVDHSPPVPGMAYLCGPCSRADHSAHARAGYCLAAYVEHSCVCPERPQPLPVDTGVAASGYTLEELQRAGRAMSAAILRKQERWWKKRHKKMLKAVRKMGPIAAHSSEAKDGKAPGLTLSPEDAKAATEEFWGAEFVAPRLTSIADASGPHI